MALLSFVSDGAHVGIDLRPAAGDGRPGVFLALTAAQAVPLFVRRRWPLYVLLASLAVFVLGHLLWIRQSPADVATVEFCRRPGDLVQELLSMHTAHAS